MANDFGKIKIEQKTGDEKLTLKGRETGLKLIDFWKWSVSDIVSNATRPMTNFGRQLYRRTKGDKIVKKS